MSWLADVPVQRKLRFAMLFTNAVVLILASGFFLGYEYVTYRRGIAQSVAALARVTAGSSTAAIAFNDAANARESLEALRAEPQILAAALYDPQGRIFATYAASPGQIVPPSPPPLLGTQFTRGQVVRVEPVVQNDLRLGTLYLRATLVELYRRMRLYTLVVIGVLGAGFALAWFLAQFLQRSIARPILGLAATADAISRGSDYSLRAREYGRDELGRLTTAFNSMLERTQSAVSALRESEARFRHMADGAPVQIWLADAERRLTWVNQRWLDFAGRPLEREVGRGWTEHIHPDDAAHTLRRYSEAFDARENFQLEYRLRRHDGQYRWILNHGVPRVGAAGEFNGYIGSCLDVTDRKRGEQEVAEARDKALAASRAKDEFLARLSHELRTPLNPVLLVSSDSANNPELPEPVRTDFDMIAKNVALEARLIDDLLDLTRIVRGKLTLDLRSRDLHGIVRDAIGTVWPDLEAKRLRLTLDLAADRTVISVDAVRLQQVFWNVLKNAVKFTPEEGFIAIRTRALPEPDRVLVTVADSGFGMTPIELERIFDAFSQGDHAQGEQGHRFGGLGLGLAISRMLVELHGGSIRATSAGRQQGSTFEIELPLTTPEGEAATVNDGSDQRILQDRTGTPSPAHPRPEPGPRGRVLVVEDHAPTGRTLTMLLTRRGFEVVSVGSVGAAREAAANAPFLFVISDIGLPDGDGYALMVELRARQPDLRGVALSGYGAEQDVERSRVAGFADHLTKPINVDALDDAIERLLAS